MGRRGPKSQPTALKLLKGTRDDRINDDEPAPAMTEPIRPEGMADEVGEVWDRVVAELRAMSLLYSADTDVIRCYCEAVWQHQRASHVLAGSQILVKGAMGGLITNPAMRIQRDQAALIRQLAAELGLTPSSRSTIRGKEAGRAGADENPFADAQ